MAESTDDGTTSIVVPEGYRLTRWTLGGPVGVQVTSSGVVLVNLGCPYDDPRLVDGLREVVASTCAFGRSMAVTSPVVHALPDVLPPADPEIRVVDGFVVWLVDVCDRHQRIDDAHLGSLLKGIRQLTAGLLLDAQYLYLDPATVCAQPTGEVVPRLRIMEPDRGTTLVEILAPSRGIAHAMTAGRPATIDPSTTGSHVDYVRVVASLIPTFDGSRADGQRWLTLANSLAHRREPLLVPTNAQGGVRPMRWGETSALPAFVDRRSLNRYLVDVIAPLNEPFGIAQMLPGELCRWVLGMNGSVALGATNGNEPCYLPLPAKLMSNLAG